MLCNCVVYNMSMINKCINITKSKRDFMYLTIISVASGLLFPMLGHILVG